MLHVIQDNIIMNIFHQRLAVNIVNGNEGHPISTVARDILEEPREECKYYLHICLSVDSPFLTNELSIRQAISGYHALT